MLERRAAFLFNRDPAAAEEVLRRVLEIAPRSLGARRMLATLMAARGGEKGWRESQQLLETSEAEDPTLDRRLQAVLLVHRGGKENLLKARRILEKLTSESGQSVPGDHLLLARLLETEGKTSLARQEYLAIVGRTEAEPAHLAQYVDFLLRHGASDEVAHWLEKLQQRLPDDLGVLALEVRWLHDRRRNSEIGPKVESLAGRLSSKLPQDAQKRAAAEAQLSLEVGNIYTAAEQYAAAEQWYRRLLKAAPRQFGPLVVSLGRQNRPDEAVDVCLAEAKTDHSARPATILAGVLSAAQPSPEAFRRAEPLLAESLASHPDNAELLTRRQACECCSSGPTRQSKCTAALSPSGLKTYWR